MGRRSVVVVGAGVFGAWSALRLARDGWQVTLVDAYGPANGRASSSDHSRVIRAGYGDAALYTQWAVESLAEWHWLSRKSSEPLVVECGVLFLGAPESPHLDTTAATLAAHGVTHERLTAAVTASPRPPLANGKPLPNWPAPSPKRISTLFCKPPSAKSGWPSRLKSPVVNDSAGAMKFCDCKNVPAPLLSCTDTRPLARLATARSSAPSPRSSTSATRARRGCWGRTFTIHRLNAVAPTRPSSCTNAGSNQSAPKGRPAIR